MEDFSTVPEIMKDIKSFLGKRFESHSKGIEETLQSIESSRLSYDERVEIAGTALQEFWKEYSREHIAKILEGFPKIQKALFGLELHPELGERYRDHFLHMFNIFVFGSRILSKIVQADNNGKLMKQLLKVTEEPKELGDLFDKGAYTAQERLYFLWILISTFHDVGIPIEHLPKLKAGINSFLNHFGLRLSEFRAEREVTIDCRLNFYLNLMARMYGDGIKLQKNVYAKTANPHPYVHKALLDGYNKNDHGIISAICLFKSIEETFYRGQKEKERPDLDMKQIDLYESLVFEHDITRAALAIAFHDLKPTFCPKLFPISFKKFPLSYLLIFCDELQEYFRLEGISLEGVTPINSFPFLHVKVNYNALTLEIKIRISYEKLGEKKEKSLMNEINSFYARAHQAPPGNFQEHMDRIWKRVTERLEEKLSFKEEPIKITLEIYEKEKDGSSGRIKCWNSPC
jgi:hypothetical protein